jgi:hypothetical protein
VREALAAAGKALDECRSQAVWGLSEAELTSCVDKVHALAQQVAAVEQAEVIARAVTTSSTGATEDRLTSPT